MHYIGSQFLALLLINMNKLSNYLQTDAGIKRPIVDYNRIRHQFKNSECGVYSINFIF